MKRKESSKFLLALLAVFASLVVLPGARAQEGKTRGVCGGVMLVPVEQPEPEPRAPGGGPFTIVPTFGAGVTAARRVVFEQAINEWQTIIETAGVTPNNYPISFSYAALGGSLAEATTTFAVGSGDLISTSIEFDTGRTWFEDPTPGDDSEFDAFPRPPGYDLLSVARHEIGHAVGWLSTVRVTVHLTLDGIFDSGRLNIATTDEGAHAHPSVHVNDLMVPSIFPSTRQSITLYPDAGLVARGFFYTIPMRFADPDHAGAETGSANEPWNTMAEAFSQTPVGIPILLASGTYNEAGPVSRTTATTLSAARDSVATISPP